MAAQVISLLERVRHIPAPRSRDWTQAEIAEFYRVESALLQAGVELESERGMTDEGDPWFVFCRADTGEVFIHFARENGRYVVDGGPFGAAARGDDFTALVRELIGRHPLAATRRGGSNVFLHPAALLIALVGACFFHSGQAKAAETAEGHAARAAQDAGRRHALTVASSSSAPAAASDAHAASIAIDAQQAAVIVAAMAIAVREAAPASAAPVTASPAELPAETVAPAGLVRMSATASSAAVVAALAFPDVGQSRAALAVVAVLHDLLRLQAPAAAAPAAAEAIAVASVGQADPAAAVAAPSAAPVIATPRVALSGATADATFLVVHVSLGALPQVEAVALVRGAGVLALLGADHIDRIDQLPQVLATAIAAGEHIHLVNAPVAHDLTAPPPAPEDHATGPAGGAGPTDAGATPAAPPEHTAPPASDDAATPTIVAPPVVTATPDATPSAVPAPTGSPSAETTAGPPAPAQPAPTPAPTPTPTPVQVDATPPASHTATVQLNEIVLVHGHSAAVDEGILKFTAAVNAGMLMVGSELIIYDPHVLKPLAVNETLDSVTFHFDDGSSVSLVGTTTSLHDLHGIH